MRNEDGVLVASAFLVVPSVMISASDGRALKKAEFVYWIVEF